MDKPNLTETLTLTKWTNNQISGTLVKVTTTAACAYRSCLGGPIKLPDLADAVAYTEIFLPMIDLRSEPTVPFSS
jgi:hypothetical protein